MTPRVPDVSEEVVHLLQPDGDGFAEHEPRQVRLGRRVRVRQILLRPRQQV